MTGADDSVEADAVGGAAVEDAASGGAAGASGSGDAVVGGAGVGGLDPAVEDAEPGQGVASRQTAWTALVQIDDQSSWASPVVDRVLSHSGLDARDRSFAANLVFSTLRWEGTLDWILAHLVSRGLDAVQRELLNLLRLGVWELRYGAAPSHAVVNAWVEVARTAVGPRTTGFVNGILRNVDRRGQDLPWPDPDGDQGLALQLGYPVWVVTAARQRFVAPHFAPGRATEVLEAGNRPAPLTLRAVAPREQVLAALDQEGISARPGAMSSQAVILADRQVPSDLSVIADGRAIVQDQSSQVVGLVAADGLGSGSTAIDLCAAPGGKATHLAQMGLQVTAVDRHAGRLRRAAAMATAVGLDIKTLVADGTTTGLPPGSADLVLLDAPCSGLGVVRRRPELRWRKTPEDIPALQALQRKLLAAAIELVRPGGRVVYSVCTWTTAETDDVVAPALSAGTVITQPPSELGMSPVPGTPTQHGTQLTSDLEQGDGMYIALLRRVD